MRPVVVIGLGGYAATLRRTVERDAGWVVAGFAVEESTRHCVDEEFLGKQAHEGIPVIPFDALMARFPPRDFDVCIAVLDIRRRMEGRRHLYERVRELGYEPRSFVDSRASCDAIDVEPSVLIHAGAVAEATATIGIGGVIRPNAVLSHDSTLGDHSYLAPGSVVAGRTNVGAQVFVGAGAVIRDGVTIGDRAIIGAGAVVLRDVDPREVVVSRAETGDRDDS
jgi:sugar O-acyltransferase (sialic acid O-acetyltransferase NeuD family)